MSLDQAALQQIADRMRASFAIEASNRERRNRHAFELALDDDDDWFSKPTRSGGGEGTFAPQRHEAVSSAPRMAAHDLEPPRGKAGRISLALPPRRSPAGGAPPASKLASGYQPAVLKVISYGHGVARATAIGQYIQKEGVSLETHDARVLATQEAVAEEMKEWSRGFDRRRESEDVATFRLSLAGEGSADRLAEAIQAGFAGHGYAYRIDELPDGSVAARVVTTMAGYSVVHGEDGDEKVKHRFHLSDARQRERHLSAPSRSIISARIAEALGIDADGVSVSPYGQPSHGKAGVVFQLSRLTHDGAATGAAGAAIASEDDVRQTAQAWDKSLNSYRPRDAMHMILSAKAGEDRDALVRAARNFLHEQFPNHKFAFGMHADMAEEGGHIHVHAIVAVKGEDGQRLRPGPADLRAWRALYAEHAEAQGMKIVATSASYRASSQSYGPRDKAIVAAAERPREGREARDRAYARANPHVIQKSRQRIEHAKANPIKIPLTARQLQASESGLQDWRSVAKAEPESATARHYIDRMTRALRSGNIVVAIREGKGIGMSSDATAAEMRENLKEINDAVHQTAAMMNGQTKAEFLRRAAPTMELLAIRTDLKSMEESGATRISEDAARQLAGPRAEALIQRAHEIEATERLEAERAREIRNRAVEQEQRDERSGAADPASLQQVAQDREMVRNADSLAAREAREAQAATEAARMLAQNPNERLDPNAVKGERLEELQRQQSKSINTTPVDGEEPDSQKPQSQ